MSIHYIYIFGYYIVMMQKHTPPVLHILKESMLKFGKFP